jgi:superfamily I DNA and/or RNA helicase
MALKRIILVGDHRQLPHILDDGLERELDRTAGDAARDALHTSLFARMFGILQDLEARDGIRRTVTLDVQYRMHPVLGDFVSDVFYQPHGEGFRSGRAAESFAHGLEPYGSAVAAWIDVPLHQGGEQRESTRSYYRMAEAMRIADEARRILDANPDFSVGVITFYSAQVCAILEEMVRVGLAEPDDDQGVRIAAAYRDTTGGEHPVHERLRVGTVDSFQGKEFDVVLLSMTRSNDVKANDPRTQRVKYGHLRLENRLCVAMSRQQRLLVVVGDAAMMQGDAAAAAVPGLVRFYELCGGPHGIRIPN